MRVVPGKVCGVVDPVVVRVTVWASAVLAVATARSATLSDVAVVDRMVSKRTWEAFRIARERSHRKSRPRCPNSAASPVTNLNYKPSGPRVTAGHTE